MAKIDDMLNDPDFMALPEEDQYAMIDELRQADFKGMPNSVQHPENILQKAAKAIQAPMAAFGQAYTNPQFGMMPGVSAYMGAHAAKDKIVDENIQNPLARAATSIISDPETLVGVPGIFKAAGKGLKPLGQNIKRVVSGKEALKFSNNLEGMVEESGSALSKKMGNAIEAVQKNRPEARVSFLDDVTKPQMDKKVTKLIDKTDNLKLYDLDNLSLKDSQQVINDLKANLRQSLKTGDLVKSDEREIIRFIDELKTRQRSVFPEIDQISRDYGEGIEAYKEVAGEIPGMLEGKGSNRIVRAAKEGALKKSSPEAFKQYKGFKNTQKGVQLAKGAAAGTAAYGLYKKFGG